MTISAYFTKHNFWIRVNGKGISVRWKGTSPINLTNNLEPSFVIGSFQIKLLRV